jgi:hypothetical protein
MRLVVQGPCFGAKSSPQLLQAQCSWPSRPGCSTISQTSARKTRKIYSLAHQLRCSTLRLSSGASLVPIDCFRQVRCMAPWDGFFCLGFHRLFPGLSRRDIQIAGFVMSSMFLSSAWFRFVYLNVESYMSHSIPVIVSGTNLIPPASTLNYVPWAIVGFFTQYIVRRRHFGWWSKYNCKPAQLFSLFVLHSFFWRFDAFPFLNS